MDIRSSYIGHIGKPGQPDPLSLKHPLLVVQRAVLSLVLLLQIRDVQLLIWHNTNIAKGRVPIIKMEIFNGICHEGGGGSRGGLVCH